MNEARIIRSVKQSKLSFAGIGLNNSLHAPVYIVPCRSDSSSETSSSCCHKLDPCSYLE